MAATDVRITAPAPAATRPRRGRWVAAAIPWIVAAVLAASLIWAIPRSDDSQAIATRLAALDGRVGGLESRVDDASERLAALRERLRAAEERGRALREQEQAGAARIQALQARVVALREAAAREAASALTPPGVGEAPVPPEAVTDPNACAIGPAGQDPDCPAA